MRRRPEAAHVGRGVGWVGRGAQIRIFPISRWQDEKEDEGGGGGEDAGADIRALVLPLLDGYHGARPTDFDPFFSPLIPFQARPDTFFALLILSIGRNRALTNLIVTRTLTETEAEAETETETFTRTPEMTSLGKKNSPWKICMQIGLSSQSPSSSPSLLLKKAFSHVLKGKGPLFCTRLRLPLSDIDAKEGFFSSSFWPNLIEELRRNFCLRSDSDLGWGS